MRPFRSLVILLVAAPLAAQRPADQAALAAFRDTLAATTSLDALTRLHVAIDHVNSTEESEYVWRLRRSFIHLRTADRKDAVSAWHDVRDEFDAIATRYPKWSYAWFGKGLAELGSAESQLRALTVVEVVFGKSPLRAPKADLARSLEVDSTFAPELARLIINSARQHLPDRLETMLAVVRSASMLPGGRHPDMLLARGMFEHAAGDIDSAVSMLAAYRNIRPDDPLGELEAGASLLHAGNLDGAAIWYRGLRTATPTVLALYRDDLAVLMPDSVLRRFDRAADGAARVEIVHAFWDSRNRDGIPVSAERLRDHYVRLDIARRDFTLERPADLIAATPALYPPMDDRGAIYIRDGAPDFQTSVNLPGVVPNVTWYYNGAWGDTLLFNFAARPPAEGFRMVASFFDIVATSGQAKIAGRYQAELAPIDSVRPAFQINGAGLIAQTAQELLIYRSTIPLYASMLNAGVKESAELQAEERRLVVRSNAVEEKWKFAYELPLHSAVELVAMGGTAGKPELQVAFAIPAGNVIPTRLTPGFAYPVRMRAAVLSPSGEVIARVDTTRIFYSAEYVPSTSHLLGRLPLHLAPGDYQVRVALESGSSGDIQQLETVHLSSFATKALTLSDLALGARAVRLTVPGIHGDTAWINPLHEYPKAKPLELYAEVGGLSSQSPYHVDISVVRLGAKGEPTGKEGQSLKLGFEAKKVGDIDALRREISLARLSPGEYRLEVVVSTVAGERVSRQRRFTITK